MTVGTCGVGSTIDYIHQNANTSCGSGSMSTGTHMTIPTSGSNTVKNNSKMRHKKLS
jgi:hypothetical protein